MYFPKIEVTAIEREESVALLHRAKGNESILEKARALGIREFIMKPIVLRELAGAVRRVLDEKKDQK